MVDPQASRFWQAALQSGLIDAEGLHACFEAIVPEKRVADQLDRRLARQAVQQGRLTLWQAQQLLAGRSTGFKINRYLLIDMIGQGGMGRVYLARDTRLNRRVALKILSPERMNNPRAIARFQREARVGAQLQHENLVRIYDEGEANGKCYLVMEYIEGKNIGAIIAEDGPIPPATAARLTQQVALGLEHAQQKGLIHRDVNPFNILVTRDGIAKLTDLGLAIDQSDQAQVTREGATVGTFDYVSPEQARHSHSVDTRSDIYSLGCTLYHMLTGQVPYPSPSLPEKLFGHQSVDALPVSKLVPDVPEGLSDVVARMMRKSPDERYPTPLSLAQALEPFTDNPAGSAFASQAATARGVSRASMTGTQVVGPLRIGAAAAPAATEELPNPSSSSVTRPLADPAPPPTPAPAEALATPSPSRSNEDWGDLGLKIDLGPEPSLTEGLASRKKKARSSPEIAANTPVDPALAPAPAPSPDLAASSATPNFPNPGDADPASAQTDGLAGLGLALDLGPEPPLSPTTPARPRTAPATPRATKTRPALAAMPWLWLTGRRRWIGLGLVGVVAVVALAGLLFGSGLIGPARPDNHNHGPAKPTVTGGRSTAEGEGRHGTGRGPETKPDRTGSRKGEGPEVPADQSVAVRMPDGTVVVEPSLKGAFRRAIGSKGHVLLNNRAPIKLSGPDAAITIGGGRLSIRAAEGARPVLEVEIKGPKPAPFLITRTDTPLTLTGVTIVAHYSGKFKVASPLIQAGGNVTLDRCAFKATGAVQGSRAVDAEGSVLSVNGCWFEGFDTALQVEAFASSNTTIRQSMIVGARTGALPVGWAIRVRKAPGGTAKAGRRLVLDHCTALGTGLLDLVDFSPEAPFRVSIQKCATLADALLCWQTSKPGTTTPLTVSALDWTGEGNQYDIRGKIWIVQSPDGTLELPDAPTDLASWRSKMTERDPLPPPIRFQVPPESLSDSPRPRDLAINDPAIDPPGADPARVGPGATPGRP